MSMTQKKAVEQYERAHDELMVVAENYKAPDEAREIALMAADTLTLEYIDAAIEEVDGLNSQYETFVDALEKTLHQLEKTMLDRLILVPLNKCLKKAKKKSPNHQIQPLINEEDWSGKLDLIFKWFRIRMGWN